MAFNNSTWIPSNTSYRYFYSYTPFETAAIVFFRCIFTVLAIPSNVVVIFIIARVQSMRTSTNYLLVNLCIADLLIAVFSLPFVTVDLYITEYWVFGEFMCRIVSFSKSVGTKASILILMALSVERYLTICRPKRVLLTTKRVYIVCIVLWVIAIGVTLPLFIVMTTITHRGKDFCLETWSPEEASIYTCVMLVLFYIIPLLVMVVLYVKIGQKLWHSTRRTNSMRLAGKVGKAASASKTRLTKICIVIILTFALSWAPSYILTLIYYFGDASTIDHYVVDGIVYPIVTCVAFSNCALNPLLYCFMSQNFRNAIVSEWKRLTTKRKQRLYDGLPGMLLRSRTVSTRLPPSFLSKGINEHAQQESSASFTMFESSL